MINFITATDLAMVEELSSVHYETLGMHGIISPSKISQFHDLRDRLKKLSDFFKQKYDTEFGLFRSENSTGNPVGRGKRLRRVWSGIYKGSKNKQYAAQISFVIGTNGQRLDIGFYFGRASSLGLKKEEREIFENELLQIGSLLHQQITTDTELRERFYTLFELGFKAEIKNVVASPERWLENARLDPQYSSVTISISPNSLGYIDLETIDFYVSLLMPLIGIIPEQINAQAPLPRKRRKLALTPEQWAKKAERLALIGLEGERLVMKYEEERLRESDSVREGYPRHIALESIAARYDILSIGPGQSDVFIEVKTTTFPKTHPFSKTFFLSAREWQFYQENKAGYRLYRVWSVYENPSIEEIDLENVTLESDGFKGTIHD